MIYPLLKYTTNLFLHFIIDYPWAGSLKPVSNKMGRREQRRGTYLSVFYDIKTNENLASCINKFMIKCISI